MPRLEGDFPRDPNYVPAPSVKVRKMMRTPDAVRQVYAYEDRLREQRRMGQMDNIRFKEKMEELNRFKQSIGLLQDEQLWDQEDMS